MQTYTHLAVGTAIGGLLAVYFPHQPLVPTACIIASIGPDLVMAPPYILAKLAHKPPLAEQGKFLMALKEMEHSLLLCMLLGVGIRFLPEGWKFWQVIGYAFVWGWLSHIVIDIFTHGAGPKENRPYWETDLMFMWPLPIDLRPLGLWEYRYGTGILWPPKPFEAIVLGLATGVAIVAWTFTIAPSLIRLI
jgi:hypothetical protein